MADVQVASVKKRFVGIVFVSNSSSSRRRRRRRRRRCRRRRRRRRRRRSSSSSRSSSNYINSKKYLTCNKTFYAFNGTYATGNLF